MTNILHQTALHKFFLSISLPETYHKPNNEIYNENKIP